MMLIMPNPNERNNRLKHDRYQFELKQFESYWTLFSTVQLREWQTYWRHFMKLILNFVNIIKEQEILKPAWRWKNILHIVFPVLCVIINSLITVNIIVAMYCFWQGLICFHDYRSTGLIPILQILSFHTWEEICSWMYTAFRTTKGRVLISRALKKT